MQTAPPGVPLTQLAAGELASPTLAPSLPSPTQALDFEPTVTPSCEDGLRFLADLSVPDGSVVSPGDLIDKRWQVENSGACNWDERYSLRLAAGPEMGASKVQALYPARSNTQAVIRILFTAPQELGTYRSAWQAFSPQGVAFGDPIYIEIVVVGPGP